MLVYPHGLEQPTTSGYRARRCGFFTPCQECFSPWEWCIIQPVFGPGVHPLYKTRKGKVYGPFLLAVFKLPALFYLERELNNLTGGHYDRFSLLQRFQVLPRYSRQLTLYKGDPYRIGLEVW